ncbi:sugar-binding protein [Paenibacillus silvisoli]|uniref:sugar-binding protein n=1 Tax=Paenibacillus silvisoli TaxID=3110539 RepID=UPI0028060EEB|nr:sugar-binding protein [Paenibacillus silvisoli]
MRSRTARRWMSSLLIALLAFASCGTAFGASTGTEPAASQTIGQQEADRIGSWLDSNWMVMDKNGGFKPGHTIKKGEFLALVNAAAGYIAGDVDGKSGLNKQLTRQEAADIIASLQAIPVPANAVLDIPTLDEIAAWAKAAVNNAKARDVLLAIENEPSLKPNGHLTWAEVIIMLIRALHARPMLYSASEGFSDAQGKNQWYYQQLSGSAYTNLTSFNTSAPQRFENPVLGYPWVSADAQHPQASADSVRKWVAPGAGKVDITGGVHKGSAVGDGIVATIKINGTELWTQTVTGTTDVFPSGVSGIPVTEGDAIYFIVGKNINMDNDHTFWNPTVAFTPGEAGPPPVQTAAAPVFNPSPGTYAAGQSVTLSTETAGAVIRYTTDDSTPTAASAAYTGPIAVETTTTVKAVAMKAGMNDSAVSSGLYTIITLEPGEMMNIMDFGAVPNDDIDDLPSIKDAAAAAKSLGKTLYVPSGEFLYDGLLTLDGVDMTGDGDTSILKSLNLNTQAVFLTGDGSDLSMVKLTTIPASVRLQNDDSARVWAGPQATNFTIQHITIDGGSSAGIFSVGKHGVIRGNTVMNTLADGTHITGLSEDLLIEDNRSIDTGDDQIAIVSYEKFGDWVKNVTIRNNHVSGGHARGITVSGGENVLVENNLIEDNGGAGVYIASEGNYKTYTVKNLTVRNNTIMRDSRNAAVAEKGGIRVQATNQTPSIDTVLIENNTLADSNDSAILIVGTAPIQALQFKSNTISNPQNYGILVVKTVQGVIDFTGNTVSGAGKAAYSNLSGDPGITSDMPNDTGDGGGNGNQTVAAVATPVIDGIIDDVWANATELAMDTVPNGLAGSARVLWDEHALHFLFKMKDTTPNTLASAEHNDSVEVWVDELNAKRGPMGEGDYMLRVGRDNAVTVGAGAVNVNDVVSHVTEIGDGYIAEFSVPYTALQPQMGSIIGFNASANDDSDGDGKRNVYISWVNKDLPYWADTKVYNEVTLAESAMPVAAFGKPVIDGAVDALWANSTPLQMGTTAPGTTGTARVAWDSDALYYLFEMTDSTPNAVGANEHSDSVEVWVDETNAKRGAMGAGDYFLRVGMNDALSTVSAGLDLSKVEHAVTIVDGGYIVEFAVPFTALSPEAYDVIGFNASANDDSDGDGKRNEYISWVDKNLPYWADTSVYNEVVLGAP